MVKWPGWYNVTGYTPPREARSSPSSSLGNGEVIKVVASLAGLFFLYRYVVKKSSVNCTYSSEGGYEKNNFC